MALTS